MGVTLPPKLRTPPAAAEEVHRQLTSVIAGHPQAATTYAFYEEIDARAARQVVDEALRRRQEPVQAHQRDLARSPEVRMRVLQAYPAALQPRAR